MTSETTHFTRRHALLATFAAVAFLGATAVAQAQDTDTMRSDPPASDGSMTTAQSGTTGMDTSSPTQTTPGAQDADRAASQGMAPDPDAVRSRIDDPDSDLRNDRTTMARAPRADRN